MTTRHRKVTFDTTRENKTRWTKQAELEGSNLADWIAETLDQRCYDYNVRGMRAARSRPREVIKGRPVHWFNIVALIATMPCNSSTICKELGIHRSTFMRHLADLERTFGVSVEYVRPDGSKPGWYEIKDWGVLEEQKVLERYGPSASPTQPSR